MADINRLDRLERRAVEAVTRTYDIAKDDTTARFWIQKGIEGMRLAVAEEEDERSWERKEEPYAHLPFHERVEAIRESNQRAGGDPYGG